MTPPPDKDRSTFFIWRCSEDDRRVCPAISLFEKPCSWCAEFVLQLARHVSQSGGDVHIKDTPVPGIGVCLAVKA